MKMKKILIIIFLLFINIFTSGCIIFQEDLNFTYEELSEGLLRIEYVELNLDDSFGYDTNEILIMNYEEQEFVLQEMNKIIFKTRYGTPVRVPGKTLIFVYDEYELWIRQRYIDMHSKVLDRHPEGKPCLYYIQESEELQKIIDYIDLNFVSK